MNLALSADFCVCHDAGARTLPFFAVLAGKAGLGMAAQGWKGQVR